MENDRLFVYGTLLPGLAPPDLVPILSRIGEGRECSVGGLLFDFGPYPGLVVHPACILSPSAAAHRLRFESAWSQARLQLCPVDELKDASRSVRGLFHELPGDPSILAALDEYEGCDFDRILVEVQSVEGEDLTAWVYVISRVPASAKLVESGSYLDR